MEPPLNFDKAQAFCCCQPYGDYHICIYAGGGSVMEHNMYWGFIIYDSEGIRRHHDGLPFNCLDVDDGMRHCQEIIDKWNRGITYEDVFLWRAICEYLWLIKDKDAYYDPTYPTYINQAVPGCLHLIGLDRTMRQMLWDLYTIQLVKWEKPSRVCEGWCLKGNWEDKIWFLEQVYILDKNPDTLPRPWLEKWERKQQQKRLKAIDKQILDIVWAVDHLEQWVGYGGGEEYLRHVLQNIARLCREAHSAIASDLSSKRNFPT